MSKPVLRCRVQFNGGTDFAKKFGLKPGGRVQQTIDRLAIKYCYPLVPVKEGILRDSVNSATKIGSGEINYPGPYAHFQYVGYVRTTEDGRVFAKKDESKPVLTNRPLDHSKSRNPNAKSKWFEEMKRSHAQDILEAAIQEANKKGG